MIGLDLSSSQYSDESGTVFKLILLAVILSKLEKGGYYHSQVFTISGIHMIRRTVLIPVRILNGLQNPDVLGA